MTSYDRSHKDHHYWDHVRWDADYLTREEREAKKALKAQPVAQSAPQPIKRTAKTDRPKYRDYMRIENGFPVYYSVRINTEPVRIDGIMV